MRTTKLGSRVVVMAVASNRCFRKDQNDLSGFEYAKNDLGVMVWDWDPLDWLGARPNIRVIWDRDPEQEAREVILSDLTPVGIQRGETRVLAINL